MRGSAGGEIAARGGWDLGGLVVLVLDGAACGFGLGSGSALQAGLGLGSSGRAQVGLRLDVGWYQVELGVGAVLGF